MAEVVVNKPNRNTNGTVKASIALVAIFLVMLGSTYQMLQSETQPLNQRIDFLERQLGDARDEMIRHEELRIHAGALADVAQLSEKFTEVETQFRALRELLGTQVGHLDNELSLSRGWRDAHDLRVVGLNSAQWERIKALERQVYGIVVPVN